ncbi:hypothetical protein BJX66DRAFT_344715 [Aspergillus keveii]|uniref:Uncharacterized protein n=1 Tax=Aspergillus keveii TaxID=714993 RepID=A0ABR4FK89_9EURO
MERNKEEDIVVVAVWTEGLANVYNALDAATTLVYSDTGTDPVRDIWDYRQEFLVDNDIAADEYRVLAVFKGHGESRTEDAVVDIEDEIQYRTGVRDD